MSFSTVQLGRLLLKELPNPTPESVGQSSGSLPTRTLQITGQENSATNTTAGGLSALHDDIQGLSAGDYLIPVIFGDKADRNGFYQVGNVQDTINNPGGGGYVSDDWQIALERVGSQFEVDLESRVTGPGTVGNDFSLTGTQWCSPPAGAYAFTPVASSVVTRGCQDGPAQPVYTALGPALTSYRWGCSPGNYGNGRCRFVDSNGTERSGTQFSITNLNTWTLSNGIVQVTPGATGAVLDVSAWTNGAWQPIGWDLTFSSGTPLSGWSSVNLLRNDYEAVTVRLVKDDGGGRILIDLTLRRGSRFVEVYITCDTIQALKIVRHSSEGGTSATGTVTALVEDTSGNKYTIGSARTFTADTANGGISTTTTQTTFDAYIGVVAGQNVLNANPYFESGVTSWTGNITGCTFAQSSVHKRQGNFSALMTPDGVTTLVHVECEQEPVTAGQPYQLSAWVWPTATITSNVSVSVNWFDASHTYISTTSNTTSATAGQWNFLTANNTAPAGAAFADVVLTVGGTPAASNLIWWDEAKIRPAVPGIDLAAALLAQYAGRKGEYVAAVKR